MNDLTLNIPEGHVECRRCFGGGIVAVASYHLGGGVYNDEGGYCPRCGGYGHHEAEPPKPDASAIGVALLDNLTTAVTLKLKGVPLAERRIQTAREALVAHGRTEAEVSEMVAEIEAGWRAGKRAQWTPEGGELSDLEMESVR